MSRKRSPLAENCPVPGRCSSFGGSPSCRQMRSDRCCSSPGLGRWVRANIRPTRCEAARGRGSGRLRVGPRLHRSSRLGARCGSIGIRPAMSDRSADRSRRWRHRMTTLVLHGPGVGDSRGGCWVRHGRIVALVASESGHRAVQYRSRVDDAHGLRRPRRRGHSRAAYAVTRNHVGRRTELGRRHRPHSGGEGPRREWRARRPTLSTDPPDSPHPLRQRAAMILA
jgi:hypothetical protein